LIDLAPKAITGKDFLFCQELSKQTKLLAFCILDSSYSNDNDPDLIDPNYNP